MASAVLERQAVALPDFDRGEREIRFELDAESRRVLGTTILTPEEQAFYLRLALSDLGIRPYTKELVVAYQKEMEAKANREIDEKFARRKHKRHWRIVPALLGAAILWALVGILFFTPKTWEGNPTAGWIVMPPILLAVISVFVAMSTMSEPKRWSWQFARTGDYGGYIPTFAAQSALAIKKRVPWAQFSIEELSRERIGHDPFLVVYAGDERHYIEVWGEPKFQGRAS
ncbi:MAG: hypothetical protein A2122_02455 [Candidatus Liptonbacteria bacterium GWB1_49_6]|uniref:Uncharacterized protein n=1 Tax=Candidatus Liptonbacteria bacterium GWB1_49_6 TaxID=1798644 RepID=A0A1G2C567_9BACT|nr:MAG: hypothetical protein A2122_02455 [Candidatus Liptonbacteria bacterium GWB1_49_6]